MSKRDITSSPCDVAIEGEPADILWLDHSII